MRISRDNPGLALRSRVSAILAAERSHIATSQPAATSRRTSSRPIPLPPPVTTASLPAKLSIPCLHPLAAAAVPAPARLRVQPQRIIVPRALINDRFASAACQCWQRRATTLKFGGAAPPTPRAPLSPPRPPCLLEWPRPRGGAPPPP